MGTTSYIAAVEITVTHVPRDQTNEFLAPLLVPLASVSVLAAYKDLATDSNSLKTKYKKYCSSSK